MTAPGIRLDTISLRTNLLPGDLGKIVTFHGVQYAREFQFDCSFEAYVAEPLAGFVKRASEKERLWIAEYAEQLVGCIAIVSARDNQAQLRWFLVDPMVRGLGLGTWLLREALSFARQAGYHEIILWTVSELTDAARRYRSAGFTKVQESPAHLWGVPVVEEMYLMRLKSEVDAEPPPQPESR